MFASLVLNACLTQAVAQDAPVDRLIESVDWIGIARVEALHPVEDTVLQLVELSVQESMFGPAGEKLFAFPTGPSSKEANVLELGTSYVLFLERRLVSPNTKPPAVERMTGGTPLYTWRAYWKVEGDRVTVTPGALPSTDGPTGVAAGANGDEAPRKELHDWLDKRIGASLPCIRVSLSSTGPRPLAEFTIGPDGTVRGLGASSTRLDRAHLQQVWDGVLQERFHELPEQVGASSSGPCSPTGSIEVRRRDGVKRVYIHGPAVDRLPASERDAAERALRIWRALPIAEATFEEPKK